MNNLQIGDNDLYGNRFNGHDLHLYLNAKGIESKHLVWEKHTKDSLTFEIANNDTDKLINRFITEKETRESLHSMLYVNASNIIQSKYFLEADIVHYHLLHNYFFGIPHIPILSKLKPTIWTLHDPWALTGHCIYPFDCDKWKKGCNTCVYMDTPFAIKADTASLNWEMKRIYYAMSDFDVVVASKWMYNIANESPLLVGKKIHIVPFGLNLLKFKPNDTAFEKKKFGISSDSIVLCFRNSNSEFKGMQSVRQALRILKTNKKICILTFNEKGNLKEFKGKYQIVELGWVVDEELLISAYNASDIFLMPSKAEAFGMMAMEAMACGKPSIVFDGTSLPEVIHHPEGGVAVPMGDIGKLTHELEELINNDNKRKILGTNSLELAKKNYDKDRYVKDIISVYEEVLDKRKSNQSSIYILDQLKKNQLEGQIADQKNTKSPVETDRVLYNLTSNMQYLVKYKLTRFIITKIIYPLSKLSLKLLRLVNK